MKIEENTRPPIAGILIGALPNVLMLTSHNHDVWHEQTSLWLPIVILSSNKLEHMPQMCKTVPVVLVHVDKFLRHTNNIPPNIRTRYKLIIIIKTNQVINLTYNAAPCPSCAQRTGIPTCDNRSNHQRSCTAQDSAQRQMHQQPCYTRQPN